jgi:hypothetical protein
MSETPDDINVYEVKGKPWKMQEKQMEEDETDQGIEID